MSESRTGYMTVTAYRPTVVVGLAWTVPPVTLQLVSVTSFPGCVQKLDGVIFGERSCTLMFR